jgi:hypothetical protein
LTPREILVSDWLLFKKIFSSETAKGHTQEPSMPSLAPFGQAVSEKIFLTLANQKKELILAAMFVGRMEDYLPLKFASVSFYCQVSDTGSVG